MESIIDQLRVHDGNLFKSESVLAVYVDFKRLVLDTVLLALSAPGGLKPLLEPNEDMLEALTSSLITTEDALRECLLVYAKELSMTPKDIARKTFVKLFLSKMTSDPAVVSRQISGLDPIKQDFVCREVFRRCLVLHVDKTSTETPAFESRPLDTRNEVPEVLEELPEIHPDDSASHIINEPDKAPEKAPEKAAEKAPSVLSRVVSRVESRIEAPKSVAQSVAESKVTEMSYRKPGIRRVVIEDDSSTILTGRRM
jgi:hypothetical protein